MVFRASIRSHSLPPSSREGMVASPNAASTHPAWGRLEPSSSTRVTVRNGRVNAPSWLTARAVTRIHTVRGSRADRAAGVGGTRYRSVTGFRPFAGHVDPNL